MKIIVPLFFTCVICLLYPSQAMSQTADPNWWIPNGVINKISSDDSYTYIGGAFTYAGPNTGGGAKITTSSALPQKNFPIITGTIYCALDDGNGGWYIGGGFIKVGNIRRTSLAHIFSDGKIDLQWDPVLSENGTVNNMIIIGTYIYVAGSFDEIGGLAKKNLAKIHKVTGATDPAWNPDPNAAVNEICSSGSDIFVGGDFTSAGGQSRNNIAKLNNTTGAAITNWNPDANGAVLALAVKGANIYVGGRFGTIGGLARPALVRLSVTTGAVDAAWHPNFIVDDFIGTIAVDDSGIYIGGSFAPVDGVSTPGIAKLNATNGAADIKWHPDAIEMPRVVQVIQIISQHIYIAGFNFDEGVAAPNIFRLDNQNGEVDLSWKPVTNNSVGAIATNGTDIIIGGDFNSIGGKYIKNLARLNNSTGELDTVWHPVIPGAVNAMTISGSYLYIGGNFRWTTASGMSLYAIARITIASGKLDTTWAPGRMGSNITKINAIVVTEGGVYVGGKFSIIGGLATNNIARLNKTNGNADASWHPAVSDEVRSIAISGNDLYIGGSFKTVNGQARNRLAKLSLATSNLDAAWNPNADGVGSINVNTLAIDNNIIYAGGNFTSMDGQPVVYAAKLNNTNGDADLTWNPQLIDNIGPSVNHIVINKKDVFIGGLFSFTQGGSGAIKVNNITGEMDTSWVPNAQSVSYILIDEPSLFIGGGFSRVNDINQRGFARYPFSNQLSIAAASPTTFCDGGKILLISNFSDNIQWYKNNVVINGSTNDSLYVMASGRYSAKTTANGQNAMVSNEIVVTVNPTPSIGTDTTVYHNCINETTNLHALFNTTGLTATWNTPSPAIAIPGNTYKLIVTNSYACADTISVDVILEVAVWTGTASTNWHTAANWDIGKVPDQRTHVIIRAGTPNKCTISTANGAAGSVQVPPGAALEIGNNRKLLISKKCISLPAD